MFLKQNASRMEERQNHFCPLMGRIQDVLKDTRQVLKRRLPLLKLMASLQKVIPKLSLTLRTLKERRQPLRTTSQQLKNALTARAREGFPNRRHDRTNVDQRITKVLKRSQTARNPLIKRTVISSLVNEAIETVKHITQRVSQTRQVVRPHRPQLEERIEQRINSAVQETLSLSRVTEDIREQAL